jgi:hypothetical protein
MKYVLALAINVFLLTQCNELDKKPVQRVNSDESTERVSESLYRYSPYFPGKQPTWMSYDNAIEASKFNRIVEVSKYRGTEQTEKQKLAADLFYQEVVESLRRQGWFDVEKASASGYLLDYERDSTHYENAQFLFDGEVLNPKKPEYLMFYETSQGIKLVGAMFIIESLTEHGEQFGGQETTWHFHDYGKGVCAPVDIPKHLVDKYKVSKQGCEKGYLMKRSTEMLHVWVVEHPEGRYATNMAIDESFILAVDKDL